MEFVRLLPDGLGERGDLAAQIVVGGRGLPFLLAAALVMLFGAAEQGFGVANPLVDLGEPVVRFVQKVAGGCEAIFRVRQGGFGLRKRIQRPRTDADDDARVVVEEPAAPEREVVFGKHAVAAPDLDREVGVGKRMVVCGRLLEAGREADGVSAAGAAGRGVRLAALLFGSLRFALRAFEGGDGLPNLIGVAGGDV